MGYFCIVNIVTFSACHQVGFWIIWDGRNDTEAIPYGRVLQMYWRISQPEERSCFVVWWRHTAQKQTLLCLLKWKGLPVAFMKVLTLKLLFISVCPCVYSVLNSDKTNSFCVVHNGLEKEWLYPKQKDIPFKFVFCPDLNQTSHFTAQIKWSSPSFHLRGLIQSLLTLK